VTVVDEYSTFGVEGAIAILNANEPERPLFIQKAFDLTSFGYFQRSTVNEMMTFFMRECARRTASGERRTVYKEDVACHCWGTWAKLGIVVVTTKDYPQRVAFALLLKLAKSFTERHPFINKVDQIQDTTLPDTTEYNDLVRQYQNPTTADPLERTSAELDEIKEIVAGTLEELCERDQKLSDLVRRSNDLSADTKRFLTTAESQNACCNLF
jgi:synaptobrevin family protein YKT6